MSIAIQTKEQELIYELLELAKNTSPVSGARTVAAVVRRGRLLCLGNNQYKTHPLQARFGQTPKSIYQHAEINALVNAKRQNIDLRGKTLYIVRSLADGSFGTALPCQGCWKAIRYYGISAVVASDYDGCQELSIS